MKSYAIRILFFECLGVTSGIYWYYGEKCVKIVLHGLAFVTKSIACFVVMCLL